MNHQLLEVTQVPPLTRKYLMKLQAQCLSLSQANVRLTFTAYLIGDPIVYLLLESRRDVEIIAFSLYLAWRERE